MQTYDVYITQQQQQKKFDSGEWSTCIGGAL